MLADRLPAEAVQLRQIASEFRAHTSQPNAKLAQTIGGYAKNTNTKAYTTRPKSETKVPSDAVQMRQITIKVYVFTVWLFVVAATTSNLHQRIMNGAFEYTVICRVCFTFSTCKAM